jgi:hypothetical protein
MFMAHRGLFVATVGIPLAKCNNGNNNNVCDADLVMKVIGWMHSAHASVGIRRKGLGWQCDMTSAGRHMSTDAGPGLGLMLHQLARLLLVVMKRLLKGCV